MKTIAIFFFLLMGCLHAHAQNGRLKKYVFIDRALIWIQSVGGKETLQIQERHWDNMTAGTKYTSEYLHLQRFKRVLIEIADQHYGACKRGIGFSCSIYDDKTPAISHPVIVNHRNRIASILLKKELHGMVTLIFLDTIDWESLQQNR